MYKVPVEDILLVCMFDLEMRLHIIAASEYLATNRAFMLLGSVYVRVMPPIGHRLVARHAAVQCWKSSGKLDEESRVVDIVITPRRRS